MKKKYFNNSKNLTLSEKRKIINCYQRGDISCFFSKTIKQNERFFADKIGVKYAVATSNCTASLYLAYCTLHIKEDENIILPNYTHPATIVSAIMANCKIKLCDCKPNSYDMDINHLEKLIDNKTKAIVFVHLRGLQQNIEEVLSICKKHNLILIEDVAQGYGVNYNNKIAGTFGDISCFSFNDSKHIKLGEGGMLLTNNPAFEQEARILLHEGEKSCQELSTTISNGSAEDIVNGNFEYIDKGLNFRPFPPSFSILENKAIKADKDKYRKFKLCDIYSKFLDKNNFTLFDINDNTNPLYFPLIAKTANVEDIVSNFYNSNHPIGKMMYTTLNKIKGFSKHIINFNDNFDNSENLYKQLLFLPLSKNINEKTAKNIALFLNSVIDQKPKQINDKNEIKNFDGLFLW